jgi:hypothetical protein
MMHRNALEFCSVPMIEAIVHPTRPLHRKFEQLLLDR